MILGWWESRQLIIMALRGGTKQSSPVLFTKNQPLLSMTNPIIPFYQSTGKVVVRSDGFHQYDSEGKQYTDFDSGVWCVNLGHNHSGINRVLQEQMNISVHHGYKFRNLLSEHLSEKLLGLNNLSGGQSVFLSSGSEVVNLSITLAKHLTGRNRILKTDNSYLSAYGHGQISDQNTGLQTVKMNDIEALSQIDFREFAAYVFEPGTSFGLIRFPDPDFVELIARKAREAGCFLIADEVTTGLGRTGKWFGYQHYNIQPDMVVCGKALGNGYPVSSLSVSAEIARQFEKSQFRYAQSHQNDPLGCAVALEVIRIFGESGIIRHCHETGCYFREKLEGLKNRFPGKIADVRARGLMLAAELVADIDGESISNRLFDDGFVVGFKQNVLRFMPPLTITKKETDLLVDALERNLSAL